jgi:hypothetical protein
MTPFLYRNKWPAVKGTNREADAEHVRGNEPGWRHRENSLEGLAKVAIEFAHPEAAEAEKSWPPWLFLFRRSDP